MIDRTNHQWMADLHEDSPMRIQAADDLHEFLERGLYHYLSHTRNDLADSSAVELRHMAQEHAEESLYQVLDSLPLFRDTSQFTTWAAKFAARVATADLKCARSMHLEPEQLTDG